MMIRDLEGAILFQGRERTLRRCAELAVRNGADLSFANFRHASLRGAVLDGANLTGASFWRADLSTADIAGANLDHADLRLSCLKDACLAESIFRGADFRGAYFSRTILDGADLSGALESCPRLVLCDLAPARCDGAGSLHQGEVECPLSPPPVVIDGHRGRTVIFATHILKGGILFEKGESADPLTEC